MGQGYLKMNIVSFLLNFYTVCASQGGISYIPHTKTPPEKRMYTLMRYNNITNELIIFGGYEFSEVYYNDVWKFSIASGTFTNMAASSDIEPSNNYVGPRYQSGGFIDSTNNKLYIFGGIDYLGVQNDFWSFDLIINKWNRENPNGSIPSPRYSYGFVDFFIGNSLKFAIFGGKLHSNISSDLYIYDLKLNRFDMLNTTGDKPPPLISANLEYYNNSLYMLAEEQILYNSYFVGIYKLNLSTNEWTLVKAKEKYAQNSIGGTGIIGNILFIIFPYGDINSTIVYSIDLNNPVTWNATNFVESCVSTDSFGFATGPTDIFVFGGYDFTVNTTTNRLMKISSLGCTILSEFSKNPPARLYHTMEEINGDLFLFGGLGFKGILGDMWKYSSSYGWELLTPSGEIPGPRLGHSSASNGGVMVIWGGKNSENYLNDLHMYISTSNTWVLISPTGIYPSPRQGACVIANLPKIYIFGGETAAGLSNELWLYDSSKNLYSLLYSDSQSNYPEASSFSKCAFDNNRLIIMMGMLKSGAPSSGVFSYDLAANQWTQLLGSSVLKDSRSLGIVLYFPGNVLVISGESWGTDGYFNSFYIDFNTGTRVELFNLPFVAYAGAFALVKTVIYSYGGGHSFGSTLSMSVPNYNFFSIDLSVTDYDILVCSPGSYYDIGDDKCFVCPPGTYAESFGQTNCVECKAGTYNPFPAASSNQECIPCPEGSYSNNNGSTYCYQCPSDKYCPIGSTMILEKSLSAEFKSIQPNNYQANTVNLDKKKLKLFIALPILLAFWVILFYSIMKFKKISKNLDIFTKMHNHYLHIPIVLKKTKKGGLFTVIFVIISIFIIALTSLNYQNLNIDETKSLMPTNILEMINIQIESMIILRLALYNYAASCNSDCVSSGALYLVLKDIHYSSFTATCYLNSSICISEIMCYNCHIQQEGTISYTFQGTSSYTSAITFNITSNSSIPDRKSSIEQSIISDSGLVFYGFSPTEFYVDLIPSIFKSYASEYQSDLTGYHLLVTKPILKGSQYEISNLPFTSDLNINVVLLKSTEALYTTRSYNQSLFMFLGTMLGSVFGIMGALSQLMSIYEKNSKKYKKWVNHKNYLKKLMKNFDMIKSQVKFKPKEINLYNSYIPNY